MTKPREVLQMANSAAVPTILASEVVTIGGSHAGDLLTIEFGEVRERLGASPQLHIVARIALPVSQADALIAGLNKAVMARRTLSASGRKN